MPSGRWPDPPGPFDEPADDTLPARWARRWAAAPERPVLVEGRDPGRRTDGAQLDEVTRGVAGALAGVGVAPGDRVLWSATASLASVAALLGSLRAGAVLVPMDNQNEVLVRGGRHQAQQACKRRIVQHHGVHFRR